METIVARDRHRDRHCGLDVVGTDVYCKIPHATKGYVLLRLGGEHYDAEPLRVAIIDSNGAIAPPNDWPGQLCHGEDPILKVPFACVRGTYEYHTFPGHNTDPWDAYRDQIRLPDLLDHLLRKAGR